MHDSRRAANLGADTPGRPALLFALSALCVALASTAITLGVSALRMARRVRTPAERVADTKIIDVDTAAQTITLNRTADTQLPGRYGLFTQGSEGYLKLGSVLASDNLTVKRKLLTQVSETSRLAPDGAFSGWYYERPEELHLPFTPELVNAPAGPCPAWFFPAGDERTWVIQVHGRGTTRSECLRAVSVFHARGISSLVVSYRNDGEAPRSRSGTYTLGATEWHDIDAAIEFAISRGAQRVIVMGWSMGGAIALQVALNTAHPEQLAGLILESPVVDWKLVLGFQGKLLRIPRPVTDLAIGALKSEWASVITRSGAAVPLDRLDIVARAGELRHPILILHSDNDGFVPSDASHGLHQARPDLVELDVFQVARHTKLWNYDQGRWSDRIGSWLVEQDLIGASEAADS